MYLHKLLPSLLVFLLTLTGTLPAQDENPILSLTPETGFQVNSSDGYMGFRISTRLQQQAGAFIHLNNPSPVIPEALIRRARIRVHASFFENELDYFIQVQMDRGNFVLSNAEFRWKAAENLKLSFGQLWPTTGRQFRTASCYFQMIDRSPVARFFAPGYDIGMTTQYKLNITEGVLVKSYLSITHGEGMNASTARGGLAYAGRLELLPLGDFEKGGDYVESDVYREEYPRLSLGAAFYYNRDAYTRLGNVAWQEFDDDIIAVYADGVFKYNGFALLAEFVTRTVYDDIINSGPGIGNQIYSEVAGGGGISIQAGKFISEKTEPTFRISVLDPVNQIRSAQGQFHRQHTYTLGVNHFLRGHNIKIQFELNLVDETYSGFDEIYVHALTQFSISI